MTLHQKYFNTSKSISSRQKVRLVSHNYIKIISWRQKIHQDIKVTLWRQRYVKMFVKMTTSYSWCQKYVMTSKSSSWHQKVIHDVTSTSWRQKVLVMTSKSPRSTTMTDKSTGQHLKSSTAIWHSRTKTGFWFIEYFTTTFLHILGKKMGRWGWLAMMRLAWKKSEKT